MKCTHLLPSTVIAAALSILTASAQQVIPNTGQVLTPTAPKDSRFESLNPGLTDAPEYLAGQAATTIVSPDKKTLLILTSGYNRYTSPATGKTVAADSNEYVFVYDISNIVPVKKQVLEVPNTYHGIVFDPSGTAFYVSGGVNDNVHIFGLTAGIWAEELNSPIALGHKSGVGNGVAPAAAGIAITADGKTLVVTDYYNDAVSVLAKSSGAWSKTAELDLRPGKIDPVNAAGVPGGEYPFWVSIKGNSTAYISSIRDREIDVVSLEGTPAVTARIKVAGQPNKSTLSSDQSKLYVAEDQTDSVDVIDTVTNQVTESVSVGAPAGVILAKREKYLGQNTNSVTVSPNGKLLYVTNGNMNDVAVVELNSASGSPSVIGLIPTGWYPNSVSFSGDGSYVYVVNGKSVTGPNPGYCYGGILPTLPAAQCAGSNGYNLQLIKAGLQSFPVPTIHQLTKLTEQVARNNHFDNKMDERAKEKVAFLQSKIKHVIFIIRENRTYDQILGDLENGNGDPDLAEFGAATTPNQHALASQFVTLDNFYDRSEVSMDGWPWTVNAEALDVVEHSTSVEYAGRGLSYDSEGSSRNVNVSLPTLAERLKANPTTIDDADVLPGTADIGAPDGPNGGTNKGHIWDAALRAGLTVRNYGFFLDQSRYSMSSPYFIPYDPTPYADHIRMAYPTNDALQKRTDLYYRGFDTAYPDYWKFNEWYREFQGFEANGGLANLNLVRLAHDHTGSFSFAAAGVNTPELQQADCDYAVGLVIQAVANSRKYSKDTLVFVIEDDSQNGGDHVDSHRSIAFVAGPYVKQGQTISTPYNTVDFIRTIEEVLGMKPMNLNDAVANPMLDVFNEHETKWSFTAKPSALLATTTLGIPPGEFAGLRPMKPTHDNEYWASVTKGMDFSKEDALDFVKYNKILWEGMMGGKPYPATPSGLDLRNNRAQLLHKQANNSTGGGL